MKHMPLFFVFSLLLLMGCQESSKRTSGSSQNNYCAQNPWAQGCYGATTTGGTVGGTTGMVGTCDGQAYWQTPGCAGFCQYNTSHQSCGGSSTNGATTGGTTNPYPHQSSNPIYQNWGVQYPGGVPQENCSAPSSPSGVNYPSYETRKATMSIQGKTFYSPASAVASQYMNTSSILKNVNNAQSLFQTDSVLKVRFKPRPQPENTSSSPYCYIPSYSKMSSVPGYTKLQYSVTLVGKKANGTIEQEPIGNFTTTVNSCTPAIDLSSYTSQYPGGIYLTIGSVRSNQGPTEINYTQYGFGGSNSFTDVRSMDCWVMDVEVAADGTKTFD